MGILAAHIEFAITAEDPSVAWLDAPLLVLPVWSPEMNTVITISVRRIHKLDHIATQKLHRILEIVAMPRIFLRWLRPHLPLLLNCRAILIILNHMTSWSRWSHQAKRRIKILTI